MKRHVVIAVITVLCVGLFCSFSTFNHGAQAQGNSSSPAMPKISVLNPLGTPPPVKYKQMAPRLDTLDGKTIYIVDDGYIGGDNLLNLMVDWFKKNYPNTTALYKRKGGMGFEAEDPALWAEMKEKADAIIIGLGH